MKGKFGTVGAIATAFVSGFTLSGVIQEIWRQQRPEVQTFPVVTPDTPNKESQVITIIICSDPFKNGALWGNDCFRNLAEHVTWNS